MVFQKTYFGLLAISVSTLALTGCINHPNAFPGGYTYHHDTYKSPTPPPSSKVTVTQHKYMDSSQAEQFRDAVYDLLDRITRRAGMPPKPAYILAPDPMTTFYANIDNDLREGMRHIGYALSDTPTGAYIFIYEAELLAPDSDEVSTSLPNIEISLKVFDSIGLNARMLTEESENYFIQGAEVLHIPETTHNDLPLREKILKQVQGVDDASYEESPVTINDGGPTQALSIDSSRVFHDEPTIEEY